VSEKHTLIIIPTYNERENIQALIAKIFELHPDFHILIMDDGSPDGTANLVRESQLRFNDQLHLIEREGKGGRGSAVLAGFQFALERNYDLIFEMDSDFSHKPEEITLFLQKIQDCDMVLGSRYLPQSEIHDWGWKRMFFSRWANRYARLVLGIPISDYTNGFRCYRRSTVQALNFERIEAKGYVVLSEVAYQLHRKGLKIGEVPIVFINRRRGVSNLSFHEIKEAFLSVLRIRFRYHGKSSWR